ncbi:MAG: hypothetical protein AB7K04_03015 [Pseudorhodoplanes sp.]
MNSRPTRTGLRIAAAPRSDARCRAMPTCAMPRIVLQDHDRLPWRFFGRMTASILAGL